MADNKNIRITLKDVRGSFLHLVKPQERTNDDGKLTGYVFNGNFLIPKLIDGKKNPLAVEIAEASKKVIEARWPGQNKVIGANERCFYDGEPRQKDEEGNPVGDPTPLYDGYAGCYVLSASNGVSIEDWEDHKKNPVQLLGPRKEKQEDGSMKFPRLKGPEAEKRFYSGGFYDVVVSIYAYDGAKKGHKNRVSASLDVVKFKRDGQAFGAAPINAEEFLDDEDDDALDDGLGGGTDSSEDDDLLG